MCEATRSRIATQKEPTTYRGIERFKHNVRTSTMTHERAKMEVKEMQVTLGMRVTYERFDQNKNAGGKLVLDHDT